MLELTDIVSCVLLMHMKKSTKHLDVDMEAAVGVVHYQQTHRQNHYNRSVQPYILLVVG